MLEDKTSSLIKRSKIVRFNDDATIVYTIPNRFQETEDIMTVNSHSSETSSSTSLDWKETSKTSVSGEIRRNAAQIFVLIFETIPYWFLSLFPHEVDTSTTGWIHIFGLVANIMVRDSLTMIIISTKLVM